LKNASQKKRAVREVTARYKILKKHYVYAISSTAIGGILFHPLNRQPGLKPSPLMNRHPPQQLHAAA